MTVLLDNLRDPFALFGRRGSVRPEDLPPVPGDRVQVNVNGDTMTGETGVIVGYDPDGYLIVNLEAREGLRPLLFEPHELDKLGATLQGSVQSSRRLRGYKPKVSRPS